MRFGLCVDWLFYVCFFCGVWFCLWLLLVRILFWTECGLVCLGFVVLGVIGGGVVGGGLFVVLGLLQLMYSCWYYALFSGWVVCCLV